MTDRYDTAPVPVYRLVPSQFPPLNLFDTVSLAGDLSEVMELVGWTNDRLVADRIARLPEDEWVYGSSNASVVIGAFLHVAPGGMRFNRAELGAWYAAAEVETAATEVAHHLRREAVARSVLDLRRTYRVYTAVLKGSYLDIRGIGIDKADVYAADTYTASQAIGEDVRAKGGAGIIYDSIRRSGGVNVVAHRPRNVTAVTQTDHYEIAVQAASPRINVTLLRA